MVRMKRKQIIIILCVLLAVCAGAVGFQVYNAKNEAPTETTSITQQAESTTQATEPSTAGESTTEAESTTAEKTTAKPQTTKPATTAKETTGVRQSARPTVPNPQTTTKAPAQISATVSITCHNAVKYGNTSVPQNGVILSSTTYTSAEGATVFDALKKVCTKRGIQLSYDKPYYIIGIDGLREKECGSGSGWMYRVNGSTPMTACNKYVLKDGDVVEWYYVTNGSDH